MVSERNFPRPPVDGGIGIDFVGLINNPDASHDKFPSLTNVRVIRDSSSIAREPSTIAQSHSLTSVGFERG
jgi:hypothetical protein